MVLDIATSQLLHTRGEQLMSACRGGNREHAQVTAAIIELDNLVNKKRKADHANKAGNRPHSRKHGTLRIVTMLPKPTKNGPQILREGIDPQWLEDNPDADIPSRILDQSGEGAAEDVAVVEPEVVEQGGDIVEEDEDFEWMDLAEFEIQVLEGQLDERNLNAVEEYEEEDFDSM